MDALNGRQHGVPQSGDFAQELKAGLAAMRPESRPAAILRQRRSLLIRKAELAAMQRGVNLTLSQLREESRKALALDRQPLGVRAKYPNSRAWRQAEIELQIEMHVQDAEDRIAALPCLEAVQECMSQLRDSAARGSLVLPPSGAGAPSDRLQEMLTRILVGLRPPQRGPVAVRWLQVCERRLIELS